MKRYILIALALAGIATVAQAGYDLTATCPYDGETAYFSGERYTSKGDTCNFRHEHHDSKTGQEVTHSYWVPCHN